MNFYKVSKSKAFPGKGVTAARLPDSVLRELQKVSARVMKEESAKDADFAKGMGFSTSIHERV